MDPFTLKRIVKFVEDFRRSSGQLPTLSDLDRAGFDKPRVEAAIKAGAIEEFYVTLTNGMIKKGYKVKAQS